MLEEFQTSFKAFQDVSRRFHWIPRGIWWIPGSFRDLWVFSGILQDVLQYVPMLFSRFQRITWRFKGLFAVMQLVLLVGPFKFQRYFWEF